jgi:hypothetical protein
MIIFLVAIIFVLLVLIVWLSIEFHKEKKVFRTRIDKLQQIVIEISQKQLGQKEQLELSEQLDEILKSSKAVLSEQIFSLNHELFELLSKNNLLKK